MTLTIVACTVEAYETLGYAEGIDERDRRVSIAVDHRVARGLVEALDAGEYPEVEPEPWQVLRVRRARHHA